MALVYATRTDVENQATTAELDQLPGDTGGVDPLTRHLAAASRLVTDATRADHYATTPAGLPSDTDIAEAFRDATVTQVLYWALNDIDPAAGTGSVKGTGEVQSSGIGSGNVNFGTANTPVVADRAASLHRLVPGALAVLRDAGLASSRVTVWS